MFIAEVASSHLVMNGLWLSAKDIANFILSNEAYKKTKNVLFLAFCKPRFKNFSLLKPDVFDE